MKQYTLQGLVLFGVDSPFKDYFGSVIDLAGGWTDDLLSQFGDYEIRDEDDPPLGPLAVWEGVATVSHTDEKDASYFEVEFDGSWRLPSTVELMRLGSGLLPLQGHSWPTPRIEVPKHPDPEPEPAA